MLTDARWRKIFRDLGGNKTRTILVVLSIAIGVFAIGAVAAGTMSPDTFARLEVYFITFAAASLLLGFWILPLMVMAVTPFRYGEIITVSRDALLTAFVANNAFIVLPMLVERTKVLLGRLDAYLEAIDAQHPPYYRPPSDSPEYEYLQQRRKELNGHLPSRTLEIRKPRRMKPITRATRRQARQRAADR